MGGNAPSPLHSRGAPCKHGNAGDCNVPVVVGRTAGDKGGRGQKKMRAKSCRRLRAQGKGNNNGMGNNNGRGVVAANGCVLGPLTLKNIVDLASERQP